MESPFQTNWFKFQNKLSVCEFGKGNGQEEKGFWGVGEIGKKEYVR